MPEWQNQNSVLSRSPTGKKEELTAKGRYGSSYGKDRDRDEVSKHPRSKEGGKGRSGNSDGKDEMVKRESDRVRESVGTVVEGGS